MSSARVSLFIQCLVDSLFPHTAEAMVQIFDRLGIICEYPQNQTCCGQPAFNSGYWREARTAARHFLEVFREAEVVVCPSGSCVQMVRHHYPELLAEDPGLHREATDLGTRTYELTEYLVDQLHQVDLGAAFPYTVIYHDSCHLLRGLKIAAQPRQLLQKVAGLRFVEMKDSDSCCGFGGSFSFHYGAISTAMTDAKIDNILASGAQVVTGCDISCLMNIQGRLSRRGEKVAVRHIAEILAATGE